MIDIGSSVGNYRVMKKLGSGAMGSVFLAEHPMIGKKVALKVIHSDLADNEEMVSRFFNEARAVTRIGHENIIEVIDFGQTPDGDNFIVMELLEGKSLGDRIKESIVPVAETLPIGIQIADGLEASHQRGIVHRDLKPDNVYLLERLGKPNFVKILDFGLAKLTQGGGALSHKTRAGSVLGTPHYMAPEQCEGKPDIDHRVDVYALGCILYQMTCGRVPFPGEGFGEVLVKHLREPPVLPTKHNAAIPRAVEAIILHALAKRKEFRFQSMREMGAALRDPEKWIRLLDGEVRLRVTGEDEPPLSAAAAAAPAPSPGIAAVAAPGAATVMAADAVPTMVEREVPPEVAQASRRAASPASVHEGSTVMLEAPQLPMASAAMRTMDLPAPRLPLDDDDLVPAQSRLAWRFMIIAGTIALVMSGVVVFVKLTAHGGAHQAQATPAPAAPALVPLTVNTVPSGAEVLADGEPAGTTPMVLKLPPGTRSTSLTFRKGGFADEQRTVQPDLEPQITVTLRAARPPAPAPLPEPAPEHVGARAAQRSRPAAALRDLKPVHHPPRKALRNARQSHRPGEDDILVPHF